MCHQMRCVWVVKHRYWILLNCVIRKETWYFSYIYSWVNSCKQPSLTRPFKASTSISDTILCITGYVKFNITTKLVAKDIKKIVSQCSCLISIYWIRYSCTLYIYIQDISLYHIIFRVLRHPTGRLNLLQTCLWNIEIRSKNTTNERQSRLAMVKLYSQKLGYLDIIVSV